MTMLKQLLLSLLALNRVSSKTSEGITHQLRILAHYDIENDGLKCSYELQVFRRNPKGSLPTAKYANLPAAMDDITKRTQYFERKLRK